MADDATLLDKIESIRITELIDMIYSTKTGQSDIKMAKETHDQMVEKIDLLIK